MYSTAHSPCALGGLRQEAPSTRVHSPTARPVSSILPLDAATLAPTLYDPEDFAALFHADKDQARALVAAMPEPLRVRQALAYAAWLDHHGLQIDLDTVLAAWE